MCTSAARAFGAASRIWNELTEWRWQLVARHEHITEGPAWDGQFLYYSEIDANRTWRYDPSSGERKVWREDTNGANGMVHDGQGSLLVCEGRGRRVTRYTDGQPTVVIADQFDEQQLNEPNDLALDGNGRIWFTDPNYGGRPMQLAHESVYRTDTSGAPPVRVTLDTVRPNGVLLSADEDELFVADSPRERSQRRQLRAYPIERDGSLDPPRILHDFGEGRGVDGMTRTTDGLVVATAGFYERGPGPMIYVFDTRGRVLSTHPTPADRPTNCTFAEKDRAVLYVTFGGGELYRATDSGLLGGV